MLVTATMFWQVVLAIHIIAVVVAFGLLVSFPVLAAGAERIDRRSVPAVLRARVTVARTLVNPGLLLVVVAGVYLASKLHQWHEFYVQWGIAAVIVLGGLEGVVVIRGAQKLAGLAQRDIDASGAGEVSWSSEYLTARSRFDQVGIAMALIVLVTCYLMAVGA